jgi:hypothetical protein
MKWSVAIFLLLVGVLSVAASQPLGRYGVKAGLTSATWNWKMAGSDVSDLERRTGVDAGIFAEWFRMPAFSLLSELHFVQKGMKNAIPVTSAESPEGTGEYVRNNVRLDLLSIAVLPKLRMETGFGEVYALAGLRLDISLSQKATVEGPGPERFYLQSFQFLVDKFRKTQMGGTVGIGAGFDLPLTMGIEVRYSPGLQSAYAQGVSDIKNTSFEFLLTITY